VSREAPTKILSMLLDEQEQGGVGMLCGGKVDVLVEVVRPELQIVVCGSGPVAMSVVKAADFVEVPSTLIDPIAPREELPRSSTFINEWHEVGLSKVRITPQTAIVLVTRHKNDVPSMRAALATPAGYIGMIGSKYRVQTILNRLAKELSVPLGELDTARVHAPIGLDIGAETPQEIALSIVSEILAHFRRATAQPKALERAAVAMSRKRSAPSAT
jgi:xanthine dehydrogenase accessory factor